ncbi:MAG: hypothetical protein M5U27_06985 [Gaiella sp.]|nr:hypothetical protein [Gaiella sp.]
MSRLDRSIAVAIIATIWAGVFVVVLPGNAAIVGHVWLVVVLALSLGVALGRVRRELPRRSSSFDAAFAPGRRAHARPATLARVERELTLASGTAFDVHYRLRPLLQQLAAGLLLRHGVDLERHPARAEALLGPGLWEVVRPGRSAPDDRTAPGLPMASIEQAIDDLERLAWS